jgi:hypothetical protein
MTKESHSVPERPEFRSRHRGRVRVWVLVGALLLVLLGQGFVTTPTPSDVAGSSDAHGVPAGIASDCSRDVTAELVAFLASVPDHSTVRFASHGCYRVDGTLELVGRNGLIIDGQGATIRATTTAESSRSHWRFVGGSGLTVRDMRIEGANTRGGTARAYVPELQHQMGIDLRGVRGVRITGLIIGHVYGDCVYVGASDDLLTWTTDVEVRDSTCYASGRSGIAVTAGRDVVLTGNSILGPGLWGVDIEPNGGTTGAVEVTIANNLFMLGAHARPFVQAVGDSGGGVVSAITVRGNTVRGGSLMTQFVPAAGQRWSDITFSDNVSDTAGFGPARGHAPGAVVTVEDVDGITVADNHQPGSGEDETFLYAARSCRVQHSGNSFPGGGELAVIIPYSCGAP